MLNDFKNFTHLHIFYHISKIKNTIFWLLLAMPAICHWPPINQI